MDEWEMFSTRQQQFISMSRLKWKEKGQNYVIGLFRTWMCNQKIDEKCLELYFY